MNKTADICDAWPDKIRIAEPIGFKDYGGLRTFSGKIETVKCYEDNSLVRKALEHPGAGKVLVVDGGASLRCALVGDMVGEIAVQNHWNGVIIYGCIRDSVAMANLKLGVKALNTYPRRSDKRNEGQSNIPVHFAGIRFTPGEFVYADEDGIVITETELN